MTSGSAPAKASLDSSLKRHTALIRRAKLSIGQENRDQILKDLETLTLEKYVEEIASSLLEGLGRCKTDKDVWAATEVCYYFVYMCANCVDSWIAEEPAYRLFRPSIDD